MVEVFKTRRRMLGCVMLAVALLLVPGALRSHHRGDRMHFRICRYGFGLESQWGLISCAFYWPKEGVDFVDTPLDWDSIELDRLNPPADVRGAIFGPPLEFGYTRSVDGRKTINFGLGPWTLNYVVIYLPYWAVILLFALLSAWLLATKPRKKEISPQG